MRVVVDRPTDHQLWARAETIAGFVEGVVSLAGLRAACGGVELPLRPCLHPSGAERDDLHGFWTEVVLQRHLDAIRDGLLSLEIWHGTSRVAAVPLWVMPGARELAGSHPLDLADYPVPPTPDAIVTKGITAAGAPPQTLVFPGLGAVGGSTLACLLRAKMLREGWATTVYDEANVPALWRRVRARATAPGFRWIDGHACYDALPVVAGDAVRVTLLRDPIRRLVSVFNYGILVHPERFAGASFDDFVAAGEARRYAQARALLRVAGRDGERDGIGLHHAAARELAHAYALVGITERFDETVFLLARLAGYASIPMWHSVLAAPRTVDPDRLAPATRRRLARDLAVDLELYAEARARFHERVVTAGFGAALAAYRAASARQRPLPAATKATECLRWRQVLGDHGRGPIGSMVPARAARGDA
ncbi:MAG: hypothetical protein IT293_10840 [Deltaproteobacteria bacterium]|nr:hypothetical protein [Deltaproteobacteria bacterium]